MKKSTVFSYAWHLDQEESEVTVIRLYGLNERNESVCLRINNFTPYIYLELPEDINWTESKANMVGQKIDSILGDKKPLKKWLALRYRLYYANVDRHGNKKKFPYLGCSFSSQNDIRMLSYKIRRPLHINGLGRIKLKIHEHNAGPILQYTSQRKIPTSGWIKFMGKKVPLENQITLCDHEYIVKWKNTEPLKEDKPNPKPLVMGFDIEVNSSNPNSFPKSSRPNDKVFQISCILSRPGDTPEEYKKYLLTLGQPDCKRLKNVNVLTFDTEGELLVGFTKFITTHNPNILVGYNILGFDIPYMIDRAKLTLCMYDFDQLGFLKYVHAKEETIRWSSSAFRNQNFQFLNGEGRLFVDLLPLVRRDYKFNNYKLKTIAAFFLKGLTKDDLPPEGIFECYRIGMKGGKKGRKALAKVGAYCVQDSVLMNMLFEKLQTWIGLTEMAKVCCVPIFYLYTKGQQIKVFSQIYRKCCHENITVEKDVYITKDDEHYAGATVFPPKPGIYDRVVPLDFMSLYPCLIIAHNLDYSTLVIDPNTPQSLTFETKWDEHVACEHCPKVIQKNKLTRYITEKQTEIKKLRGQKKGKKGKELKELKYRIEEKVQALKPYIEERSHIHISKHVTCCKRNFRWLKEPLGVLPSLLKNLLDTRKKTKQEIKRIKAELKSENKNLTHKEKVEIETLLTVLDKRQLAYKISANSAYGITGVRKGFLPFMPVAMCTTYLGRTSIEKVAKIIPEKYRGELVYGD